MAGHRSRERDEHGRSGGLTVLLVAVAPLLVLGGLMMSTSPTSGSRPVEPSGVRPDTVVVPALDVRAEVTPVGARDGALALPSDAREVGWWADGSPVGAGRGATVLTARSDGAAFDGIDELSAGDRVLVLAGRERVAYDVASVRVLSRAELADESPDLFARSGESRLVLVAADDWDGEAFGTNVVVTARPVPAGAPSA